MAKDLGGGRCSASLGRRRKIPPGKGSHHQIGEGHPERRRVTLRGAGCRMAKDLIPGSQTQTHWKRVYVHPRPINLLQQVWIPPGVDFQSMPGTQRGRVVDVRVCGYAGRAGLVGRSGRAGPPGAVYGRRPLPESMTRPYQNRGICISNSLEQMTQRPAST